MNESKCIDNKYGVYLVINTIFHVTILFLILGLFFRFYVSTVVKTTLENEIEKLIDDNISNNLDNSGLSEEQRELLFSSVDRLHKYYDRVDKRVQDYNDWLFRDIFTITGILFCLSLMVTVVSYLLCNKINVGHILLENGLIFLGVGIVEFLFFTLVARKYVPAPPSLMLSSILESLDKSLGPDK